MILQTESHGIGYSKSLEFSIDEKRDFVGYRVVYIANGKYESKEFPDGSYKEAKSYYDSLDVRPKLGNATILAVGQGRSSL